MEDCTKQVELANSLLLSVSPRSIIVERYGSVLIEYYQKFDY